jgi:hypothetical protein
VDATVHSLEWARCQTSVIAVRIDIG